ncbi:MAG: SDR family oxidoreductase [Alphaproteobacteria bacterium]|nr:SDR family oxidoreductase [Alphaproteobacteria bacterium]
MDFAGKTAFVTGGSRGIGRAAALALARRGADVAFLYRARDEQAREVAGTIEAAGRRALAIRGDLGDPAAVAGAVDRAAAELGGIDVLVAAAGVNVAWRHVAELSPEEWARGIAVDLNGNFCLIRAAIPHLRTRRGTIVAISSIAAQMCQARNAQGAAAKAGLEALIRVVAKEEARHGVRANAVAIGLTDTDMGREALGLWGEAAAERIIRGIPLGRMGTPEEVADAVCFFAGPAAAYVTGKVLQVDGGQIIAG